MALTQERLKELLRYEPETGVFTWRVNRRGPAKAGDVAGSPTDQGYLTISVDMRRYRAHHLAWLYMHGRLPRGLDHKNRDRADNRIDNLREATKAENNQNLSLSKRNTSGFPGVSRFRKTRWQTGICVDGKRRHIGYFDTPEEAHAAYVAAKRALHPFATL